MNDGIVINLEHLANPDAIDDQQDFLHREARRRVLLALWKSFPKQTNFDDRGGARPKELDVLTGRHHDAILVAARRGEGKTTFLTRILRIIERGTQWNLLEAQDKRDRDTPPLLYSLGIIDPTLIETKQNIMVVVIDRIRIATEHRRKRDATTRDGYDEVTKALRKLAQGLTLLDGIGESLYNGREWKDPDYVLDQGLEDASAAHDFERRLRDYIRLAAQYLCCDAFVLAIDDVDTWFEKGWPVLEALRKYLATPRLRIILSGDLNLFSLLVRRQQWEQMSQSFLNAEKARGDADKGTSQLPIIGRMIDDLQDQYIVKVLPPENRIVLKPLGYYVDQENVFIVWNGSAAPVEINVFIKHIAGTLLALRSDEDLSLLRRHLLRMPLRSALKVLHGSTSLRNDVGRQPFEAAIDALRHISWTELMALDFDVDETRDPDPVTIMSVLGDWLTRTNLWKTMARFHPDSVNEVHSMVALFLAAILVDVFRRSPGRMVDYWLKIATVREKVDRGEVGGGEGRGSLSDLISHVAPSAVESGVHFASRLSAWEATIGRQVARGIRLSGASVPLRRIREVDAATVELYGLNYVAGSQKIVAAGQFDRQTFRSIALQKNADDVKEHVLSALPPPIRGYHRELFRAGWSYRARSHRGAGFQGFFADGIERLADRIKGAPGMVARLPISRITSGQQSEFGNYSFLRLLGVIGEIIDLLGEDPTRRHARIERILSDHSLSRSYPTPEAMPHEPPEQLDPRSAGSDTLSDEEAEEGPEESERIAADEGAPDRALADLLALWLDAHAMKMTESADGVPVTVAPVTLTRMWTRLTYGFDSIREELVHAKDRYLGVVFHRTIVAFLHAVGIEAMRAVGRRTGRSVANNPIRSGRVFALLLSEVYDVSDALYHEELLFFDMIFSCPLWGFFLARRDSDLMDASAGNDWTSDILERYRNRLNGVGIAYESVSSVELDGPSWEQSGRTADFESLYFPLNSVPLLGQTRRVANAGRKLNKALKSVSSGGARYKSDTSPDAPSGEGDDA